MRWEWNVLHMGERTDANRFWVGNPERERALRRPGCIDL
jgi:hypothetical protein